MRNLYVLTGASGSGKGTRVVQFIMFLEDYLGLKPKLLRMNRGKKSEIIARHYSDLDFTVVGRFMNNRMNGKISWSGWDAVSGNNSRYEILDIAGTEIPVLTPDLIRQLIKTWGSNWVVEGYPELAPTPLSMWDYFDNLYDQYYMYDDIMKELPERCRIRSGKISDCKSATNKTQILLSISTQVERANFIQNNTMDISKYHKYMLKYNSPLSEFGSLVLDTLNMSELKPEYEKFCSDTPYLRSHDTDNLPGFVEKYRQQDELEIIDIDYKQLVVEGLLFRTKKDKSERATWRVLKQGKLEFIDLTRFQTIKLPSRTEWKRIMEQKMGGENNE